MPTSNKSINEDLQEFEAILAWFNQPDFDLDQALVKFEKGMRISKRIEQRLKNYEQKIEVLKQRFDQPE